VLVGCLIRIAVRVGLVEQVVDEVLRHRGVTDIAGRDGGVGDDLAVRVDRDVPLVAVETAGGGLVAVPGVLVDGGDDPVLGDLAGDPEHPVLGLLQILADDAGEQLRRLLHRLSQLPTVQQRQAGPSSSASAICSRPRSAERISVKVSIVATASYNGVESN